MITIITAQILISAQRVPVSMPANQYYEAKYRNEHGAGQHADHSRDAHGRRQPTGQDQETRDNRESKPKSNSQVSKCHRWSGIRHSAHTPLTIDAKMPTTETVRAAAGNPCFNANSVVL